jgi:putative ATPase
MPEKNQDFSSLFGEKQTQPLADRLRPGNLEAFVGQPHLRKRIETLLHADRLPSILLFGPPGCGKSTLALLLAQAHKKKATRISASEAGLQHLRRALAGVEVLVLDELHRFSKAQQDFFLPLLESGDLTMIATTTENPSFSVTRQLLSRLHLLRMHPLDKDALLELGRKGCAGMEIEIPAESLEILAALARGDGRTLLGLVEYLAALPESERTPEALKTTLPDMLNRHDKAGDNHYELASALIKSIRGSDPDAALYYLAALLEGGEDPRFICRRLILSASEDISLADPHALPLAVACQQAVEFVGMPEGFIPLAETVVYLALTPKSNSTYLAYKAAAQLIAQNGTEPVPLHLRNASTPLQKAWGYGRDYLYPHNNPAGWVKQEYLPDSLSGSFFYRPRAHGQEPAIGAWWRKFNKR